MNLYLDLDFASHFSRDNFFFGVANAPYLCEGGYNTPDGPKNSFGYFERSSLVPPSGDTTRYWDHYESHISLAAQLGLTAFRTGVEWARVQPTYKLAPGSAPEWDPKALDRYADMIGAVERNGLQPIITLHHFTHPAWLGETLWLRDDAADLVVEYEVRLVDELNERLAARGAGPLGHIITFNELNLMPPKCLTGTLRHPSNLDAGIESFPAVYDNVLSAHVRIYDAIKNAYRARGWKDLLIGFGTATQAPYELDKFVLDLVRVRAAGVAREDVNAYIAKRRSEWTARLSGLAKRQLTDAQFDAYESEATEVRRYFDASTMHKTLDVLYASPTPQKTDYISANVYEPFRTGRAAGVAAQAPRWWEFAADGDIYRTMILAYNDGNTGLPMFMGENSLAYRQPADGPAMRRPDGWTRERYFKTYLMEMVRCMAESVPIRGYLYWSLVDDFEWDAGFDPRLGLYNYDYREHKIGPTDGLGEPAGQVYSYLISALRSGSKARVQEAFVTEFQAHGLEK
jgi:beta-glucosidase